MQLDADLIVTAAYGQLTPTKFKLPSFGAVNVHASLLPKISWWSSIHYAIMNGGQRNWHGYNYANSLQKWMPGAVYNARHSNYW